MVCGMEMICNSLSELPELKWAVKPLKIHQEILHFPLGQIAFFNKVFSDLSLSQSLIMQNRVGLKRG